MDSKLFLRVIAGHVAVFACGAFCWHAILNGHAATAIVCLIAAVILVSLLMRGRRRALPPSSRSADATFTSEQSHRRLRALVDETPSPLLLQEEDGRLIAVNRAARRMFDTSSDLPAATRRELLGPTDRLQDLRGHIDWAGGRYAIQQARLDHALLAILVDITSEVRAAEASALRDLLKVLNHELMNALTPVASMSRSALDLITDNTPESLEDARSALERVVARTEGLVGFVDSYRILTRLPPPDIRPVSLAPFAEELAQAFRAQWTARGVDLEVAASLTGVVALMDAAQLRLCLTNLLNNAAEAALANPAPRVRLGFAAVERIVEIDVEDSGRGIEPDLSETIFLPFYTTKATGTGVGLSLARQILQGHDSILVLKSPSELGGAHFGFTLARPYSALNPWETV
ncbi:MAG: HAMP domain-containing histidine kinase [Asticcacaulis sp.]|nr:HAMP domain-containing histidine kinase [Asticcacaulis sp.]